MTNPLAQDLGGVVRLLEKATPGPWAAEQYSEDDEGCGVIAVNPEIGMRSPTRGQVAWFTTIAGASFESPGRAQANADLVAAMMNFFVTHSAEIAGALEQLRGLHDSIRTVYDAVPALPITADTMEAATDALHAFCLLVGIHRVDVGEPQPQPAMQQGG